MKAENNKYKETDSIVAVQSSRRPLWVTLYIQVNNIIIAFPIFTHTIQVNKIIIAFPIYTHTTG